MKAMNYSIREKVSFQEETVFLVFKEQLFEADGRIGRRMIPVPFYFLEICDDSDKQSFHLGLQFVLCPDHSIAKLGLLYV